MAADAGFSGRAVAIWSKEPGCGGVLENVHTEQLDDRTFLVGQLADDGRKPSDPRMGATFWFPVDEVLMLTVYPDVQAARAAYAARENESAAPSPKKTRGRFW